jgi:hypothetical protein
MAQRIVGMLNEGNQNIRLLTTTIPGSIQSIFQQVGDIGQIQQTCHTRATLEGVQIPVQQADGVEIVRVLAPMGNIPVGLFQEFFGFLKEDLQDIGVLIARQVVWANGHADICVSIE